MASSKQHRIRIFGISLLTAPTALVLRQAQHRRCLGTAAALAIGFVLVVIAAPTAEAQTYTVVYNFTGGGDGTNPEAEARNVNPRKNLGSR